MKKYTEIYPAEGWTDKIKTFLKEVANNKPHMYAKTKRRYEKLGYDLLECLSLILTILSEDSLVPDKSAEEFDDLLSTPHDRLLDKFREVNSNFSRIEELCSNSYPVREQQKSSMPAISNPVSMTYNYRDVVNFYDSVLRSGSVFNFGYSEVNLCAQLLYKWFHTRFFASGSKDFVCQLDHLPEWIQNFVLVFGRCFSQDNIAGFQKSLDAWCHKVETGQIGNYAIPYNIWKLSSDYNSGKCDASDYTLEALIIHDILSNGCLYRLVDIHNPDMIEYDPLRFVSIVKDRNPALYPEIRQRIAKRMELIRKIHLTPVGGSGTDGQ